MELIGALLIGLVVGVLVILLLKSKTKGDSSQEDFAETLELEKSISTKVEIINGLEVDNKVLKASMGDLERLKTELTTIKEKLSNTESERNQLKTRNTSLEGKEESRNAEFIKSIDKTITLQDALKLEKERLNDDRVKEKEDEFEEMKRLWGEHEKDVEQHIRMICKDQLLKYISQEDFPYPRNKPDNTIEISSQLIVFDAKSPGGEDLSNFPKYIKLQTDNLKKYAKHSDVKKDLFLVIPSNTLPVIKQFTYNMGDYNVYVITKDSLEPIILSLKKIQDFEMVEKLSPEDRDEICRIIGKFAHTTKRRIQVDQFFADEFLDTLKKAKTQLPKEILEKVIEFEGAEKLNPPMEKRNKKILIEDLTNKKIDLAKEIEIRNIPAIDAKITFKKSGE
jgi:signal recognition particle subunit SEC65